MSLNLDYIRSSANGIAPLLAYEPAVRANFSGADLTVTLGVIFALINREPARERDIFQYLNERELPFDQEAVAFLLKSFEGRDRSRHLWFRDEVDRYSVLRSNA